MSEENEALVRSADRRRAWQASDRNDLVLTLRRGQVVAMRAFRDLDEARSFTGEGGQRR